MKTKTTLTKPTLSTKDVIAFAERPSEAPGGDQTAQAGTGVYKVKKKPPDRPKSLSGKVPAGDIRLSSNIDRGIHYRLKMAAVKEHTTIGQLIERLVDENLD